MSTDQHPQLMIDQRQLRIDSAISFSIELQDLFPVMRHVNVGRTNCVLI